MLSMNANKHTSQCIIIPFLYLSCFAEDPPKDSGPNRKRKIIIAVVVVALGLWLLLTSFGIAWWKGYVGSRISREEGDVV